MAKNHTGETKVVAEHRVYTDGTVETKVNLAETLKVVASVIESGAGSLDKIAAAVVGSIVAARSKVEETEKALEGLDEQRVERQMRDGLKALREERDRLAEYICMLKDELRKERVA
jgi:hypothetical protein